MLAHPMRLLVRWMDGMGHTTRVSKSSGPNSGPSVSGGQICNQCKWRHLLAKFAINATTQYSGSHQIQMGGSFQNSKFLREKLLSKAPFEEDPYFLATAGRATSASLDVDENAVDDDGDNMRHLEERQSVTFHPGTSCFPTDYSAHF